MKKRLIVFCLIGHFLTGCVSNGITWSANANIKKIALGMSKEQVIQVMGNDYLVSSSSKDDDGNNIEILVYKSDSHEEYRLNFVNNRLTEWNREFTNKYIVEDPSP